MDWDGDGQLDILSGCYQIEATRLAPIQLLLGRSQLDFAPARVLATLVGLPADDLPAHETIDPHVGGLCTHQHAVDYDADGDLDLVIGCAGEHFFYLENFGSERSPQLSQQPQRLPVRLPGGQTGPHLADWDGDGDLDLLSGCKLGGVFLAENTGSRPDPVWSDFQLLIPPGQLGPGTNGDQERLSPSLSTRVWATDWNRDGQLDLLVGDCATVIRQRTDLEAGEYQRLKSQYDVALTAAHRQFTDISHAYLAAAASHRADQALQRRWYAAWTEYVTTRDSRTAFEVDTYTGFVWLFLRTPTNNN